MLPVLAEISTVRLWQVAGGVRESRGVGGNSMRVMPWLSKTLGSLAWDLIINNRPGGRGGIDKSPANEIGLYGGGESLHGRVDFELVARL